MSNKRDNELVGKVQKELLDNINVSVESKAVITELLKAYENSTFKEWDDRHEWYADMVDRMVNDCGFNDDMIADKMANNHPTLQQNFFRMVVKFIKKMAGKTYCDARNEGSVNLCKKFNEVMEASESYLPYI